MLKTPSSIHTIENIFVGLAMKSILKLFSDHGTFVQPDALKYISSKENPDDFASFLVQNLREYPLFLTVDVIKNIEEATRQLKETPASLDVIPPPPPPAPQMEKNMEKEFQKKILSKMYSGKTLLKETSDEEEDEDNDDEEKTKEEAEEKKPQPLEIKTVKGWKPLARDYESEVRVINDITGKRTSEGTTQDFVSLFRDRYPLQPTTRNLTVHPY
jgi:hypothetical protein